MTEMLNLSYSKSRFDPFGKELMTSQNGQDLTHMLKVKFPTISIDENVIKKYTSTVSLNKAANNLFIIFWSVAKALVSPNNIILNSNNP